MPGQYRFPIERCPDTKRKAGVKFSAIDPQTVPVPPSPPQEDVRQI